jgi:hypothetical protein
MTGNEVCSGFQEGQWRAAKERKGGNVNIERNVHRHRSSAMAFGYVCGDGLSP